MKAGRVNGRSITTPRSQRGVVLLIALIMLVAMTLAGIGMMRSVDTGSMIAGNLAFRHATSQASDAGTSTGFNALMTIANSANTADKPILNFNNGQLCANVPGATAAVCNPLAAGFNGNIQFPGYSSTPLLACEVTRTCALATDYTWWTVAANWAAAPTITVLDPTNGATIATVSYLIHRMCPAQGLPSQVPSCQLFTQPETGCSHGGVPLPCTSTSVFYRITSRSVGARNTITYAQSLALISQ